MLDGWTSPLIFAYLGLVIIWYAEGKINRAILEFIRQVTPIIFLQKQLLIVSIRLKSNHDGKYLAKVVAECLERFQLGDRVRPCVLNCILR